MRRPFRRSAEGIVARVSRQEKQVLRRLPDLLESAGDPDGSDEAARRLRPAAHLDDPDADAGYWEMVEGQIAADRRQDRDAFVASLDRDPVALSEEEGGSWLRVLGEARLVLAARMGIVDDYDWGDAELAAHPEGALLRYLSYLQDGLVVALSRSLPPA